MVSDSLRCFSWFWIHVRLKWSHTFGQVAKVYPADEEGMRSYGKAPEFHRPVQGEVALEALRGDKTIQEIAAGHQVHPNQVGQWKKQAVEGLADVFSRGQSPGISEAEVKDLHAKIGRLAVENDFLSQGLKR